MSYKIDSIILHDDDNIKGFFYEYRWLSNFHVCEIVYNGIRYNSSETAYQAQKLEKIEDIIEFSKIEKPRDAKIISRDIKVRSDFHESKIRIMYEICLYKFQNNDDIKKLLLDTNNKYLEETNYWNDTFWGVCRGDGSNNLGKILMNIRALLRNEDEPYKLFTKKLGIF